MGAHIKTSARTTQYRGIRDIEASLYKNGKTPITRMLQNSLYINDIFLKDEFLFMTKISIRNMTADSDNKTYRPIKYAGRKTAD